MSETCHQLHVLVSQRPALRFPFDPHDIPRNGVYILFEQGEHAHGVNRIVRVGTHIGNDQLRSRLEQHFVKENKDRSIFRKNIGRALLCRDGDCFLRDWNRDLTTSAAQAKYGRLINAEKLRETEQRVTDYMRRSFSFVAFQVDSKEDRMHWEARLIATVAQCSDHTPSATWLGRYSPKDKIRQYGLWLVNELHGDPLSATDLDRLAILLC